MARCILSSAVIVAPGTYTYRLLSHGEAVSWLQAGTFQSHVGYAETAQAMSELFGVAVLANRTAAPPLEVGEEALVFRLVYPPGTARVAPGAKGALSVAFIREHSEVGLLSRER
jgi:hypothetical protein